MRSGGRTTTSTYRQLDIRYLQRKGFLRPGTFAPLSWSCNGEPYGLIRITAAPDRITLSYSHRRNGEQWKREEYAVPLEWQPCNYGGRRAWFRCPALGCGRRVAILYGGEIFACRHCHNLAYDSQSEPPHGRALLKAQAIRSRLGGSGSLAEDFPDKPKGMHWRTYYRLCNQAENAENHSWPPWVLKSLQSRA